MTIYVDNGDTVKIYPVKVKIAKAIMTLLESDYELVWSKTHKGYGVEIVNKSERELDLEKANQEPTSPCDLCKFNCKDICCLNCPAMAKGGE